MACPPLNRNHNPSIMQSRLPPNCNPWPMFHLFTEFCENWLGSFCIILLTSKQVHTDENITSLGEIIKVIKRFTVWEISWVWIIMLMWSLWQTRFGMLEYVTLCPFNGKGTPTEIYGDDIQLWCKKLCIKWWWNLTNKEEKWINVIQGRDGNG